MASSLYEQVRQRADDTCEYCHLPQQYDPTPFQIDHIIAQQHGGPTESDNLSLACLACNNHKGPNIAGIDREEGTEVVIPLFHPRRDVWDDHFEWDGPHLRGLTPTGRVTVLVLGINLPHRVALRQSLMDEGVFPA